MHFISNKEMNSVKLAKQQNGNQINQVSKMASKFGLDSKMANKFGQVSKIAKWQKQFGQVSNTSKW